ncbi:hypothetical protein BGW80DRAFT_1377375 [Lactifluus volemus]|nr:hypothetical protein BGW80DRAFT_1377375 [Lactifluus volemus]
MIDTARPRAINASRRLMRTAQAHNGQTPISMPSHQGVPSNLAVTQIQSGRVSPSSASDTSNCSSFDATKYSKYASEVESQGPTSEVNPLVGCQPSSLGRNAISVASNRTVEKSRDLGTRCRFCERNFHAVKALNRHMDDIHSEEKKCYHVDCDFTYIGKRKLENHLVKRHGKLPRRRHSSD